MIELLLGAAFVVILFAGLIALALYLLMSFSLYTMAKNKGLEHEWLAFIPIAQMFILGRLIGAIKFQNYTVPFPAEWVLLGASLITVFLNNNFISFVVYLVAILAYYNLYMLYQEDRAVVYTVVGAIVPVTIPFFIYSIRNNVPKQPDDISDIVTPDDNISM